jgi:tetratricopeptide (TPR) repeat protein
LQEYWDGKMNSTTDEIIIEKVNLIKELARQGKADFAQFESAKLVAQYPHNVMALCVMSFTFYASNDLKNCMRYAHLAYAQINSESSWKEIISASNALLMISETDEAIRVLEYIDLGKITDVDTLSYIARHYGNLDQIEMTVNTFERISSEVLDFHSRQMYGVALLYMGKFEQAKMQFQKAVELNPRDGVSYNQLSVLKVSENRDNRIINIEAALRDVDLDSVNKAYMHFSLFNEYDAISNPEKAWQHLQLANMVRRSSVHHDVSHDVAGCKNIIATYKHLPADVTNVVAEDVVPIFIVGLPRTGTTLLEKMLSSFDEVKACGELRTFRRELELEVNSNFLNVFGFGFCTNSVDIDYARVGREYLRKNRWRLNAKKFMVDKEPSNCIYAGFIARAMPNARIIHIKRNPMDACFSNYKQFFAQSSFTYSYDILELAEHYKLYAKIMQFWKEQIPESLLEISYESLVNNPDFQAERIRKFCGFKPKKHTEPQNANYLTSTLSAAQVRAPIHNKNINAWRRYETQLKPLYDALKEYVADYDAELLAEVP